MALDPSFLQTDDDSSAVDERAAESFASFGGAHGEARSLPIRYVHNAGVTVVLTHAFELGGRLVDRVVLPPVSLGLALDVQAGLHETLLDVLVAATGEPLELFRALRGGDEHLVVGSFVAMLPDSIRSLVDGAQ